MARPTDYNEEILEKTREYLKNYSNYGDAIPSVAGLAVVLHISRTTIYDWASQEEKKEFSYILDDILSDQERVLINKGLTSEFNSNIVKLALGKHGYVERTETAHNFDEESKEKGSELVRQFLSNRNSNKE